MAVKIFLPHHLHLEPLSQLSELGQLTAARAHKLSYQRIIVYSFCIKLLLLHISSWKSVEQSLSRPPPAPPLPRHLASPCLVSKELPALLPLSLRANFQPHVLPLSTCQSVSKKSSKLSDLVISVVHISERENKRLLPLLCNLKLISVSTLLNIYDFSTALTSSFVERDG